MTSGFAWPSFEKRLRRHGRKKRLSNIKQQIHRFLAELLWIKFRQNATSNKDRDLENPAEIRPDHLEKHLQLKTQEPKNALDDDPVPQAVLRPSQSSISKTLPRPWKTMPVRTSSDPAGLSERIQHARQALAHRRKNSVEAHRLDSQMALPFADYGRGPSPQKPRHPAGQTITKHSLRQRSARGRRRPVQIL